MKFYAAIIDRNSERAVCGRYFEHAIDAWNYANPSCGYSGSVIAYRGTEILRMVERA